MIRRFCSSVSDSEAATSNVASTRVAVVFACWPPGPEERVARTVISRRGMAVSPRTGIGSSMDQMMTCDPIVKRQPFGDERCSRPCYLPARKAARNLVRRQAGAGLGWQDLRVAALQ